MLLKLPKFDRTIKLVEENRTPTITFHQWWDRVVKALQAAFNAVEEALTAAGIALDAAEVAQAAADDAQAAATAAQDAVDNIVIPSNNSRPVSTSQTLSGDDSVILADASGGAITLTLPSGVDAVSASITVTKTDASVNAVSIAPSGGELINGAGSSVSITTQFQSRTFTTDFAGNWYG